MFPLMGQSRTRGHRYRLKFKTGMRRNYFSQRVVNLWNSLPHSAVESVSLNGFKKEIDIFLIKKRDKGIWGTGGEVDLRRGRHQP